MYEQTILPFVEYVSFVTCLNHKHDVDKLQKLENKTPRIYVLMLYIDPRLASIAALKANQGRDITKVQLPIQGGNSVLRLAHCSPSSYPNGKPSRYVNGC